MSDFDLVIRGATVVDGTGGEPYEADVAVRDGRIAQIGKSVADRGLEEIDAKGQLLTPGFVDIHTHYDGHVTWEDRLAPSCYHGVTTVVMGNCGVGFAPCRSADHNRLIRLMTGVEDIPEIVMAEGLPWNWESFSDYLDVIAARPHDMDIATQFPHSALRVYVMGDRALEAEPASEDEVREMCRLAQSAVTVGALGFATSRAIHQKSSDGQSIPSVRAEEAELVAITRAMAQTGRGVIQLLTDWRGGLEEEFGLMRRLARQSGLPLSFTLHQRRSAPDEWMQVLEKLEEANAEGLEIRGQVLGRASGCLIGFEMTLHPFVACPSYAQIADLPFEKRIAALRDPDLRARLIAEEPPEALNRGLFNVVALTRDFDHLFELGDPPNYEPEPSEMIPARARRAGVSPAELAYDLMMRDGGRSNLSLAVQDYESGDLEVCRRMVEHPHTMLGLGDAGAHSGFTCDASYPTFMLTHWTRDRTRGPKMSLPAVVKALTSETAGALGLRDRGRIAEGYKADLNVIDYDRLRLGAPRAAYTLPAGGRRVIQRAAGYAATIVSGRVTYREGEPTGEMPGGLVRGPRSAPLS
jgi:N-acyl-D-aspartate/D-glutamate deacylase